MRTRLQPPRQLTVMLAVTLTAFGGVPFTGLGRVGEPSRPGIHHSGRSQTGRASAAVTRGSNDAGQQHLVIPGPIPARRRTRPGAGLARAGHRTPRPDLRDLTRADPGMSRQRRYPPANRAAGTTNEAHRIPATRQVPITQLTTLTPTAARQAPVTTGDPVRSPSDDRDRMRHRPVRPSVVHRTVLGAAAPGSSASEPPPCA